jgi:hypothetical protein
MNSSSHPAACEREWEETEDDVYVNWRKKFDVMGFYL